MLNKKRKHVFYEMEPGYWIGVIMNKDPSEYEYTPSEDYSVYHSMLQRMYQTFKVSFLKSTNVEDISRWTRENCC
jgi:hypothetical protein